MCLGFGQIFSILWPCSSNLFYQFRPSFCVLFVLWLDRSTKWPIMAFCSIRQAYCPPVLVWFYKPLFKTLCLIGWRREYHSCHNHPVDQRSPKGPSSQTSWTTSISWGSAPTSRTQRTFSLLQLHSSVQLPTPSWSARRLSDLPAGSQSKV